MNKEELKKGLAEHAKWLKDSSTGKRANLTGADLTWADLTGATIWLGWELVRKQKSAGKQRDEEARR